MAVLSSTNKASSISLSNANLTATWSAFNATVAADMPIASGKKYVEATCDNVGSTAMNWALGFADPLIDCTVNNIPAANGNARTPVWACSLSTAADAYIYVNATAVQSNLSGFSNNTTRQIVGAAVDFSEKTIQFYLNGSAIGTAVDFSAHAGSLVPAIWGKGEGAWNIITARFAAADQTYSPPSGYSAWDAAAVTTVAIDTTRQTTTNATANIDTLRQLSGPASVTIDTLRRLAGSQEFTIDTLRRLTADESVSIDTLRQLLTTVSVPADTSRRRTIPFGFNPVIAPRGVVVTTDTIRRLE